MPIGPHLPRLLALLLIGPTAAVMAWEIRGEVSGQTYYFPYQPLFTEQVGQDLSVAARPELFHALNQSWSLTFTPFYRHDSVDSERTHADIRQLNLRWVQPSFELDAGINKVFWGVTESQHLVDIINQTDAVESMDGEEKLGQPMLRLTVPKGDGTTDLFVLPYFRERAFLGQESRLRFALPIDEDKVTYQSGAEEQHIDVALRHIRTIANWELGLSYFAGTSRDPRFNPVFSGSPPTLSLAPYYPQIQQAGLDLQYNWGNLLCKLETIHRSGQLNLRNETEDYIAFTAGFEYTLYSLASTAADLGIIGEALHDSRGDGALTPYEEDLAFGFRLGLNDLRSTEILAFVVQDLDSPARVLVLESSVRLGERFKLSIEGTAFAEQPRLNSFLDLSNDALLTDFRTDDHLVLNLSYYL